MSWLMKVLNGPHMGAEAALDPGTYVLGSERSCDFVLSDVSIASQHCQLDVGVDSLNIVVLDGEVWDRNNRYESGSCIAIAAGILYRFGMIWVVFLREGELWQAPPLTSPYDEVLQEPLQETIEHLKTLETSSRDGANRNASRGKAILIYWLSIGGALLIGLGVMVFFFLGQYKSVPQESSHARIVFPTREELQSVLNASGYSSLQIAPALEDGLVISGIVSSEMQRSALRKLVTSRFSSVRVQVVTAGEIQSLIQRFLEATASWEGAVVVTEGGLVRISGYFKEPIDIKQLQRDILQDIPKTINIDWNVRTIKEIDKEVAQFLSKNNFNDLLTQVVDGIVVVYGNITASRQEEYQNILKQLAGLYGYQFLRDGVNVEDKEHYGLPLLEVNAVVLGPRSFLVTASGQKVLEGEEIGNGYIVQKIYKDVIVGWNPDVGNVTLPIRPTIFIQQVH